MKDLSRLEAGLKILGIYFIVDGVSRLLSSFQWITFSELANVFRSMFSFIIAIFLIIIGLIITYQTKAVILFFSKEQGYPDSDPT